MATRNSPAAMPNAYYDASLSAFAEASPASIVGRVAESSEFSIELTQRDAWFTQVPLLKAALTGLPGHLFLEYVVPRLGSRIDAVVIVGPAVLVLEFKIGEREYRRADFNQVWDYALDLKNFHQGSHSAPIVPILVATHAPSAQANLTKPSADGVYEPVMNGVNPEILYYFVPSTPKCQVNGVSLDLMPSPPLGASRGR